MSTWAPNVKRVMDNGFGRSRNGAKVVGIIPHHVAGKNGRDYVANWNDRTSHPTYHIAANGDVTGIVHPDRRPTSTTNNIDEVAVTVEIDNIEIGGRWAVSQASLDALAIITRHHADESPRRGNAIEVNDPNRTQRGFFYGGHFQYRAVECPGPMMREAMPAVVAAANALYGSGSNPTPAPAPAPAPSPAPSKSVATLASEVLAGKWGNGDERTRRLSAAGYDAQAVQRAVNAALKGGSPAPASQGKSADTLAAEVLAGKWGNGEERIRRLRAAGHDYDAVQRAVNARIKGGAKPASSKKSVDTIAREVIRGDWGNGETRKRKLTAAGYSFDAVMRRVNALL